MLDMHDLEVFFAEHDARRMAHVTYVRRDGDDIRELRAALAAGGIDFAEMEMA